MPRWEAAHLSEIEAIPVPETLRWTPVRRHFGIQAFGANAYTAAEAGQEVVERHTEEVRGHEELYVVISGRASFTLDGEETDAPAGTAIFVRDPLVERYAIAAEPDTTILALGGKPGVAYSPGPWEWVFVARAMLERGDFRGAIAEVEDGLEVHPVFDPPVRALRCAVSVRAAVVAQGLEVRAGVHAGEVATSGTDVRGVAVHEAARIMAEAGPGEILVSETIPTVVSGIDLEFVDRGEHELKGIGLRRLFAFAR